MPSLLARRAVLERAAFLLGLLVAMKYRVCTILAVVGLATSLAIPAVVFVMSLNLKGIRTVDIPFEETGYSHFESTVIRSRDAADRFLNQATAKKDSWNNRVGFNTAIRNARVDFQNEALILLRHTEGSGSIQVQYRKPYLQSKTLICDVQRQVPGICTCDMAYYCAAFVVPIADVETVELRVDGKQTAVLSVKNAQ